VKKKKREGEPTFIKRSVLDRDILLFLSRGILKWWDRRVKGELPLPGKP